MRDRPPIVRTVGKLPCVGVILPIFVRLVLSVPMGTAAVMQQAALLLARPSPYSAVGVRTTLFGRCNDLVLWLVYVQPSTAYVQPSTALPPPTLRLGQMLPGFIWLVVRFSTVLLPPALLFGQILPVSTRLAVRSSTVLPSPTLLLAQMLPVSILLAVRPATVLRPPTLLLGQMLPVYVRWARTFVRPTVQPPLHST